MIIPVSLPGLLLPLCHSTHHLGSYKDSKTEKEMPQKCLELAAFAAVGVSHPLTFTPVFASQGQHWLKRQ